MSIPGKSGRGGLTRYDAALSTASQASINEIRNLTGLALGKSAKPLHA